MAGSLDDRIDQLYQLPLEEFTAARNTLAKETGESSVKKLEKPNLAAWTVNQLYWRERKTYDDVIKAAERMRAVYKQMLAGKNADVRGAEEIHQEALREAKQAAKRILEDGGHPNADAVMMPVVKDQSAKERRASEAEEREAAMSRERLRFAEAAEREAEASLERAKRAVERAERTRERIEREFKEAADAEKSAVKEQAHAEKALEKAASERDRLEKKLRG
jgi:hypothetical protein